MLLRPFRELIPSLYSQESHCQQLIRVNVRWIQSTGLRLASVLVGSCTIIAVGI